METNDIDWELVNQGDEQEIKKVVEKYKKLAYKIAHRWAKTSDIESEDAVGKANEVLMRCISKGGFDDSLGDFTSYLSMAVENEFRIWYRKRTTKDSINTEAASLDKDMVDDMGLKDFIKDRSYQPERIAESFDVASRVLLMLVKELQMMSGLEKASYIMFIKGYTQKEIANTLGFSQSYISRIINNCNERIKDRYWKKTQD